MQHTKDPEYRNHDTEYILPCVIMFYLKMTWALKDSAINTMQVVTNYLLVDTINLNNDRSGAYRMYCRSCVAPRMTSIILVNHGCRSNLQKRIKLPTLQIQYNG